MSVVVDTNVAMVASGHSPQAGEACVDACVQRLNQIMKTKSGTLVVDDLGLILDEYVKALHLAGRPGAGEKFVKWAWDHQYNPKAVTKVPVTQCAGGGWRRFEEFPDQLVLANFDKSDQKFVAVALASSQSPPILNAVDSDWWNHRTALNAAGVELDFLCPQHAPSE